MFLVGMALFGATSVACGLSMSGLALVLMRFAQGAAGALLHPQVLALLGLNFPGQKRPRAFAAYAMAMGLAGVAGQLLGGALIEIDFAGTGWRSCFFINAPIALAAIVLGFRLLDADKPPAGAKQVDWLGMLLTAAALTCLIVPLTYGREALSVTTNAALFIAAAAFAAAFVVSQKRRAASGLAVMIPPALAAARHFRMGVGTVGVFYSGIASFYFVLGLHLQSTLGATAWRSGMVFSVLGAAFFAAAMSGSYLNRVLNRPLVELGALVLAGGHVLQWIVAAAGGGIAVMLVPLLVEGVGIGLVMAPLVSLALSRMPPEHAGVAAGVLSTMQSTGNAVGVAIVGLFYIAGPWIAPGPASGNLRFAEALVLLTMLAVVVWYLARRIRVADLN
jgi:MFS family permease